MKRKIILHSSFAIGLLSVIFLFSGFFSFPKSSLASTDSATMVVTSVGSTSAVLTATLSRAGMDTDFQLCKPVPSGFAGEVNCTFAFGLTKTNVSSTVIKYNLSGLETGINYSYFLQDPTTMSGFDYANFDSGLFTTGGTTGGSTPNSVSVSLSSSGTSTALLTTTENQSFLYDIVTCFEAVPGTVDESTCHVGYYNTDLTYTRTSSTTSTWKFKNLIPHSTYYYFFADSTGARIAGGMGATFSTSAWSTTSGGGANHAVVGSITNTSLLGTSQKISYNVTSVGSSTSLLFTASPMIGSSVTATKSLSSTGSASVDITGLTPHTNYTCSITSMPDNTLIADSSVCGNFTTSDVTIDSLPPVTIKDFLVSTVADGSSINFTATASGTALTSTSTFNYSLICSTSTSMVHPASQTFGVAAGLSPINLSGSLSLDTPISRSTTYNCELIDDRSRVLNSPKTVSRESGVSGVPYVVERGFDSMTIGISFKSSMSLSYAPSIYYGDSASNETSGPISMSSDSAHPNDYTGEITGLSPETKYYYSVMDSANTPYDDTTDHSFTTKVKPPVLPTITGTIDSVNTSSFDDSQKGFVKCKGGVDSAGNQVCGFPELLAMVNRIIKYLLFIIAPAICTFILAYAGYLYVTSAGSTENISTAKKMLTTALSGWLIALVAWILIRFIMQDVLGYKDSFPSFW